jgi:hypothetical protein
MGCQCAKQTENKTDEITSEKDIFHQSNDNNLTALKSKKPVLIPSEEFNPKLENNFDPNIEPPIEFTNQIEKKENENQFLKNNNNNNENDNQNIIPPNSEIEKKKEENDYNGNNINNEEDNINKKPEDEFSLYIFEHLNLLRENPQSFIDIIEESKKKITYDKNKRLVFKSVVKVALSKGEPAFDDAILVLQETKPMNKLIYNPNMNIPLPTTEEEIKDKNYLKNNVKELIKNKVKIRTYWRDIIKDPETSFILMVVDDSGTKAGNKRKDLLNPDMKYIGISSTMIGKNFVCYLCFSDTL